MKRSPVGQIHRLFLRSRPLFLPCGRELDGSIRCRRTASKWEMAKELLEITLVIIAANLLTALPLWLGQ